MYKDYKIVWGFTFLINLFKVKLIDVIQFVMYF